MKYVAEDGKIFENEQDCLEYEEQCGDIALNDVIMLVNRFGDKVMFTDAKDTDSDAIRFVYLTRDLTNEESEHIYWDTQLEFIATELDPNVLYHYDEEADEWVTCEDELDYIRDAYNDAARAMGIPGQDA